MIRSVLVENPDLRRTKNLLLGSEYLVTDRTIKVTIMVQSSNVFQSLIQVNISANFFSFAIS